MIWKFTGVHSLEDDTLCTIIYYNTLYVHVSAGEILRE